MTPIHIKEVFWVTVKRVRKAHVYRINHCKLVPASAVKKQQTKKRSIIHDFKICLLSPFQKQRPSRKEKNSAKNKCRVDDNYLAILIPTPPPSHMISSIKGCCFFLVDFLTLEDDFTAQIAVNVTKKITML